LQQLQRLIKSSRFTDVGLAARRLSNGEELRIRADQPFHPASTVKVSIMMEAFRQARLGEISLDDPIPIRNKFRSLADGSPYWLDVRDDSESDLYAHIGQQLPRRELIHRMITVSSNLASNLLLEALRPEHVTSFMQQLGTSDLQVLRGFEDKLAYRRGLNNSATAGAFLHVLAKLARREVVSRQDSGEMIEILLQQQFNEMIPANLPAGARVAHKTGWTADYHHDVGIVSPPRGEPFILCILTKGYEEKDEAEAHGLIAALARVVYDAWAAPV
jgi:beta-lactamase class A